MKLIDQNGKIHTLKEIKRMGGRISYWVILPQGTKKKDRFGVMYSNIIRAKTLKQANKIADKYNAPIVERIIESNLGRWEIKFFHLDNRSYSDLWDEFSKLKEIEL